MDDRDHDAYASIKRQVTLDRKNWLTRRKLMQASTAAAVGALATAYQPKEVFADVRGKVTLYFAEGKRWGDTQRAVAPLFSKVYPNVEINFAGQPISDFFQTVIARMSVKAPDFDVTYIDWGRFPGIHSVGAMESIQARVDDDAGWKADWETDVPAQVSDLYRIPPGAGGDLYGLTADGNLMTSFYRKDVFEAKGIPYPKTWSDAIDATKELHDPQNGQYGHISCFQRGAWAGSVFWAVHATCGGWWFDKMEPGGWNPAFATDSGYEALRSLEAVMKYAHPVTFNATEDECNKAFAAGNAVYGPLTWGTALLNDSTFTEFHDSMFIDLPPSGETPGSGNKPQMGGLGQFLNAHGENKEAAWAYMKYFNSGDYTDPAIGDAIVAAGGQPCRASVLKRNMDHNFMAGLYKGFPLSVGYLMQIPEANAIQALMGEEAADFVNGEKDIDEALKAMDERTRRLMEDGGYYG